MSQQQRFDPDRLEPGTRVAGRYLIEHQLGRGGFARVYRAQDEELGEPVALKFVSLEARSVERARQELRAARRVSHPNVVRVHDIGETGGVRFISMEYVAGRTLRELLGERERLPVGEALRLVCGIVEGVAAAHRQRVVHRDLKPANVIIDPEGRPKVLDFGIATLTHGERPSLTGEGALIGTPHYMAPEQVEGGRADERSDVYAVGVMLYELLTGRLPFEGDTPLACALARLRRAPAGPVQLNPLIPGWLGRVVLRALEREPGRRFADGAELLEALRAGAADDHEPTLGGDRVEPPQRPLWRSLLLYLAPVLLAVGGTLLAFGGLGKDEGTPAPAPAAGLLADGSVRLVVLQLEHPATDDVAALVANGLSESLRTRLARLDEVRLVELLSSQVSQRELGQLGVEQLMRGRVLRAGEELRVVVNVVGLPGRERWLGVERTFSWEESWDDLERVAERIEQAYRERLAREGER